MPAKPTTQAVPFPSYDSSAIPLILAGAVRFVKTITLSHCLQGMVLFRYGGANRSEDCHWKDHVLQFPRGWGAFHARVQAGSTGQARSACKLRKEGDCGLECFGSCGKEREGLGVASRNDSSGLWGIGVVPSCPVPGLGVIRARG